jgi:hypothetical protein
VRVPVIASKFLTPAAQAVKENYSHIHYLEELLSMESEEQDRHAVQNRIRDADSMCRTCRNRAHEVSMTLLDRAR